MSSWRDTILKEFIPQVNNLTLVADPDNLLTEEQMAVELRKRGFDLLEYGEPVEFRYAYEVNYRSLWDQGEHSDLIVRLSETELKSLPYDLLRIGRALSFDLGNIFPSFSYPVISKLDRNLLDELFNAQEHAPSRRLGDKATKDFILRYVFQISPDLISTPVDLLRELFRIHYGKTTMPALLADRLIQQLKGKEIFKLWPLEKVVPDTEAFFAFVQERWAIFLSRLSTGREIREDIRPYRLDYPGPAALPFDHQDIRVYLTTLFTEEKLAPVVQADLPHDIAPWIRNGIKTSEKEDRRERLSQLFELLEKSQPTMESRHSDWAGFAIKWAELAALVHSGAEEEEKKHFHELGSTLNQTFAGWLSRHYGNLISLPPINPAMVHQIPRHLDRKLEEGAADRIALLVIDGLSLDQWVTARKILQEQNPQFLFRESATFAWIPTLTSVSRQAIFSGKAPIFFPNSIYRTDRESSLWTQFWEGAGLASLDIAYQKGLGDGKVSDVLDATLHPSKTKVIGLVVDKVDKIMHGMQLGAAGMQNQIKQWCREGFLASLITYLHDHNFQVWLTSDHGNIECRGRGRPSEGAIAETRGERARIYPTPELRSRIASEFAFAHEWHSESLPPKYYPLLAGGTDAFLTLDAVTVGHGGISMEEVIVPFVKIERKTR